LKAVFYLSAAKEFIRRQSIAGKDDFMTDRCVCCGSVIPEGRQVCPSCEAKIESKVITNPVKAIREKCLDCCCGSTADVKDCSVKNCPLYPFRMGKNPYRQRREMTEEEKQVLVDRLKEARKSIGSSVGNEAVDDG
jgi:hypothetical protein